MVSEGKEKDSLAMWIGEQKWMRKVLATGQ